MIAFQISAFNLYLTCVLLYAASIEQVRTLKCYICHSDNNEACTNELRECSKSQAYDRCMTTIYKNPLDGKRIKKECALAPCHLRGLGNLNFANFMSDCDQSSNQDCTFCCAEDGCNKDSAPSYQHLSNVGVICLMFVLLLAGGRLFIWY